MTINKNNNYRATGVDHKGQQQLPLHTEQQKLIPKEIDNYPCTHTATGVDPKEDLTTRTPVLTATGFDHWGSLGTIGEIDKHGMRGAEGSKQLG